MDQLRVRQSQVNWGSSSRGAKEEYIVEVLTARPETNNAIPVIESWISGISHCSNSYDDNRVQRESDINAIVAGYLRDLAFTQSSKPKMFGYKRAANAILGLDVQ